MPSAPPTLRDQVRAVLRATHAARRTEPRAVDGIARYLRVHGLRHPRALDAAAMGAFRTYLAVDRAGAAATQNQARSALLLVSRAVRALPQEAPR